MTSIENSELDFSELDNLDQMSDLELDLYFTNLVNLISQYKTVFDQEGFLDELSNEELKFMHYYFQKILDIFLEWELDDYLEVIHYILVKLDTKIEIFL